MRLSLWTVPAICSLFLMSLGRPNKAAAGNDVYQTTKVWSVHLTFSPKEYAALSPSEV